MWHAAVAAADASGASADNTISLAARRIPLLDSSDGSRRTAATFFLLAKSHARAEH
jgi:hypothetical protein